MLDTTYFDESGRGLRAGAQGTSRVLICAQLNQIRSRYTLVLKDLVSPQRNSSRLSAFLSLFDNPACVLVRGTYPMRYILIRI